MQRDPQGQRPADPPAVGDAVAEPAPTPAAEPKDPLRGSLASRTWLTMTLLAVLLVLLVVFVAQNTDRVPLDFLGWTWHPPLAVALLAAVAAGLLLAVTAGSLRIWQLRRRVHRAADRR